MSYCRFSTDDFRCDLYCWESTDGTWDIAVAGSRLVGDVPKSPDFRDSPEVFMAAHAAQSAFIDSAEREDITLPHAGALFREPTLEAFRDRLLALRELGYYFPNYVLEDVAEEIAAEASA